MHHIDILGYEVEVRIFGSHKVYMFNKKLYGTLYKVIDAVQTLREKEYNEQESYKIFKCNHVVSYQRIKRVRK